MKNSPTKSHQNNRTMSPKMFKLTTKMRKKDFLKSSDNLEKMSKIRKKYMRKFTKMTLKWSNWPHFWIVTKITVQCLQKCSNWPPKWKFWEKMIFFKSSDNLEKTSKIDQKITPMISKVKNWPQKWKFKKKDFF